jgi:hypothetical protein
MTDLRLHRDAVEAFCAGHLDRRAEEELALQVARIYTCEPALPNHTVELLGRMSRQLGGPEKVLDWLSGFPGEASLVAAVIRLSDLLGALSGSTPMLDAVRQIRAGRGYRDLFGRYWAPSTDHVTLSDLAETLKHLLRRDDGQGALELSFQALDLLDEALALVADRGHDIRSAKVFADDIRATLATSARAAETALAH